jgi:hypothetical protein
MMGTRNVMIARSSDVCALTGYDKANSGNFTIKGPVEATTTSIEGTFDITFAVGGNLKGSFTAPVCPMGKHIPLNALYCM